MTSIHPSANIFKDAQVVNSDLAQHVSVGDFSKVKDSSLDEYVRIDRLNHIDSSVLGRFSYTGKNSIILHSNIGAFCAISWNVSIGGANHNYSLMSQHSFLYEPTGVLRPDGEEEGYDRYSEPVNIGSDVWIAAGAVITRGVSIGHGAVIGANAVVTQDVPPYSIVGGVPARVLKYRFDQDVIQLLLELRWWQWSSELIKRNYKTLSSTPTKLSLKELLNNDPI